MSVEQDRATGTALAQLLLAVVNVREARVRLATAEEVLAERSAIYAELKRQEIERNGPFPS